MSGKNFSTFQLPPGIFSDVTQYGAGQHWFDGNLVRWVGETMIPVGGWREVANFGLAPVAVAQVPPASQGGLVGQGGNYTFTAAPLGTSLIKYSIIGVCGKFERGGAVNAPSLMVNGVACTRIHTGPVGYVFSEWYISNDPITVPTGDIVVTNQDAVEMENCTVLPYRYEGDPNIVDDVYAFGINTTSVLTPPLTVLPKTIGLGLAQAAGVPPALVWDGSTLDNVAQGNTVEARRVTPSGLNSSVKTLSSSGAVGSRGVMGIALPEALGVYPVRALFSWRDFLKKPWIAAGSADKLWALSFNANSTYTGYDITPATLSWNPGGTVGYGRSAFGSGPFGIDSGSSVEDPSAVWSFDNFGKDLVAVHNQDGRLFKWDPTTPATDAVVVANAPIDNDLVVVTNEEFLMVFGGKNNPRKVKWASQRTLTDWTPTATNSAGGFDLQSNGVIVGACRVPQGILVVTTADSHIIQWVGPPNYYSRKRISEEGSIVSSKCLVPIPGGAMWMGNSDFWTYVGGTVVKLDCSVHTEAFYRSELSQPENVFLGVNEFAGEVWAFFPKKGSIDPDRYVAFNYTKNAYWTKGVLTRHAWMNPTWQAQPLASQDQALFEHEFGALAAGASRSAVIFAETGALEIGEGDQVMRVDRVYVDAGVRQPASGVFTVDDPGAYSLTFKLREAPNAPEYIYGPITLDNPEGYTPVRFRARQCVIRVDQLADEIWSLGKTRLRIKAGGAR